MNRVDYNHLKVYYVILTLGVFAIAVHTESVAVVDDDIRVNLMDVVDDDHSAAETVVGATSSGCVSPSSFACLQRKLDAFLYGLRRTENDKLLDNSVTVVRKRYRSPTNVVATSSATTIVRYANQTAFKTIVDRVANKFRDTHVSRAAIPRYAYNRTIVDRNDNFYLDVDLETGRQISVREGRSKKKRKKKKKCKKYIRRMQRKRKKFHKKLLTIAGIVFCIKMAKIGSLIIAMLGLKTMKALLLATIAFTIQKLMFLRSSNVGSLLGSSHGDDTSGGHGSGSHSSGGHSSGWDRHFDEMSPESTTSILPHYIEPPPAYSGRENALKK